MIAAGQILAHLVGDYLLQSDWMATEKTKRHWPAFCHAAFYTLPFLLLTQSALALAVIWWSHFLIDRYRWARYVVWLKNWIGPGNKSWKECQATGYPPDRPVWLTVWLLIIADNIIHLAINGAALRYL